ncbi:hypothetical protein M5689_018865 [Euphorbia peplus]|nr:hypothetical protein M5689_018865 [Euphorbia peplus]
MTLIMISDSKECSKDSNNFSPYLFKDGHEDEATSPPVKSQTDVRLTQSERNSKGKCKMKQVAEDMSDRPAKKLIFDIRG